MSKFTLRALRVNYNLSAQDVSDAMDIHPQTLLKYENDSSRIPLDLLQRLSNYYNVAMDDIFLGRKFDLKRINSIVE